MREELAKRSGLRGRFTATYTGRRERSSAGHIVVMCLFVDVRDELGTEVTDHVHFTLGKWNEDLQPGDTVSFEARVSPYWKGYIHRTRDYRLSHPTNVRKWRESGSTGDSLQLGFPGFGENCKPS